MKLGLNSPQDVLALLVRRMWWVVIPFVALSCVVGVVTSVLPKTYISQSLILVRPRDVPSDMVKDLIAGSTDQRLQTIQQTVLSRSNLIEILHEFNDRLPELHRFNMDEQVQQLRDLIKVDIEIGKSSNGAESLSYFRISFQSRDPQLAKDIASKLTSLFIEQDNKVRETQVNGTTDFFESELKKVAEQLNASETKLKEVKSSRQFELPSQLEANYRTLDRLAAEKKANAEGLDRYADMRLTLETQLAATPQFLAPTVTAAPSKSAAENPLLDEYRKAKAAYEDASSKYTALHPEVQQAKSKLDKLQKQIPPDALAAINDPPAAETKTSSDRIPNPAYQQLAQRLAEANTEYSIREKSVKTIDADIAKYQQRVESTPKTEQDIAEVTRQNDDLKKQYDVLNSKLADATLAESLESKQKGSQFQVIDPANYPLVPAKPNKRMVFLGGCAASLLLSIGFAVAVDVARQKIWTQAQIEALWGVPVLVDIPEILTDADQQVQRKKRMTFLAATLAGSALYAVCLYLVYVKHNFVLQQLDPLLQKVVYK